MDAFTSSSSMSACFTVMGSSWLIMSDIVLRLLLTTPRSVFSLCTYISGIFMLGCSLYEGKHDDWRLNELRTTQSKSGCKGAEIYRLQTLFMHQEKRNIRTLFSCCVTWLGVKAFVPSRARVSTEVWGVWEDRRAAGKAVTAGPFPDKVWQASRSSRKRKRPKMSDSG